MRRVCYSVAMSLDGYIAGPKGEYDWIPMDPDMDFGAMFKDFDTVLMGRKSYEAARRHGGHAGLRVLAHPAPARLPRRDRLGASRGDRDTAETREGEGHLALRGWRAVPEPARARLGRWGRDRDRPRVARRRGADAAQTDDDLEARVDAAPGLREDWHRVGEIRGEVGRARGRRELLRGHLPTGTADAMI